MNYRAFAVCLLMICSAASAEQLNFRRISVEDGLSDITVFDIAQDGKGTIWFSTAEGVDSYDGYSFRHCLQDSLKYKTPACLSVNSDGGIICGFPYVIAEAVGNGFRIVSLPTRDQIINIKPFKERSSLVLTQKSQYIYENGELTEICLPDKINHGPLLLIARGRSRIFAINSELEILSWEPETDHTETFTKLPEGTSPKCLYSSQGRIWIGTEGQGLFEVNVENGSVRHYSKNDGSLLSDYVRAVCLDKDGDIWVGTMIGLSIIGDNGPRHIQNDSENSTSLSHNSVRFIFRDRDDSMWLATYFGGVDYYNKSIFSFERRLLKTERHTSEDNIITALAEDPTDRSIWVGVGHDSIIRYFPSTGELVKIPFSKSGRIYDVKAIFPEAETDKVWIGARLSGLGYFNRKTGAFRQLSIPARDVLWITEKSSTEFYLSTDKGILIYDRVSGECRPTVIDQKVSTRSLWKDSSGKLWTGPTLSIYREDESGAIVPCELSGMPRITGLYSFFESSRGDIYCSYSEGIMRYIPSLGSFEFYNKDSGLTENNVEIIGEDMYGRIWLGLVNGFSCFRPDNKSFHYFGQEYGFDSKWYTRRCSCTLMDGSFLVGSLNGIISFRPENLAENVYSPNPEITSVEYSGENSLNITFATKNYLDAGRERFACILEGYDSEWRFLDGINSIQYSSLPAGNYKFRVRSSNSDGVWADQEAFTQIRVKPDWFWNTGVKVGLIIVLVLLIACILYQVLRNREKKIKEQTEKKIIKEYLSKMKTPLEELSNPVPGPKINQEWIRTKLQDLIDSIEEYVKEENTESIDTGESPQDKEMKAFLAKAEKVIDANIANTAFNADDFAKEMNVSRASLYMKLSISGNTSPMEMMMEARWKHACRLLKETEKQIAEIAEESGFSSASYFARAFKKKFNLMPSQYRKDR